MKYLFSFLLVFVCLTVNSQKLTEGFSQFENWHINSRGFQITTDRKSDCLYELSHTPFYCGKIYASKNWIYDDDDDKITKVVANELKNEFKMSVSGVINKTENQNSEMLYHIVKDKIADVKSKEDAKKYSIPIWQSNILWKQNSISWGEVPPICRTENHLC